MSRIADVLKELNALGAVGTTEPISEAPAEAVAQLEEVQAELPTLESSDDSYWVDITAPAEPEEPEEQEVTAEEPTPDLGVLKIRVKRAIAELELVLTQLNNLK